MREIPRKLTKAQLLGLMYAEVAACRLRGPSRYAWAYNGCMRMIRNVEEGRCSDDNGHRDDRMTDVWGRRKNDHVRSWRKFAEMAKFMNKDT